MSNEGIEEAIYDSYAFRVFMGIDFFDEQVPDATTLLKFRHLLEENGIAEQIFEAIKHGLDECDYTMRGGSIVGASIIGTPSSTNVHDIRMASELLRNDDQTVYGDSGYIGWISDRKFCQTRIAMQRNSA